MTLEESKRLFEETVDRLHAGAQKTIERQFGTNLDSTSDAGYWRIMARLIHHCMVSLYETKPLTHDDIDKMLAVDDVLIDEFEDVCWRELQD